MLSIQGYEYTALADALHDARTKWTSIHRDILDGNRPNASAEGCEGIISDLDSLISKLKDLE